MRKYWITAANAASQVIFNKVIEAQTLAQADAFAKTVVPSAHHDTICITDEDNNPIIEVQDAIYDNFYEQGYAAGVRGARQDGNPYEPGTLESKGWRDGQSDGNDNAVSAGS